MKNIINIVIDPKIASIMSEEEKMTAHCDVCLSEIQDKVDSLVENISNDFKKQRSKMSDEWVGFLADAQKTLDRSVAHQERESDQISTNSKWILGIVMGVTFALGTVVGFTWNEMTTKADKSEVFTGNEVRMLIDLGDDYNRKVYERKEKVTGDTSAYYWARQNIYDVTNRGVIVISK